jgi:hypothetical protein
MSWKDPERKKQYMHEWYLKNKKRTAPMRAAWQRANPEKYKQYLRNWERNNPRRYMIQKSRSSAKQRGIMHTITEDDLVWPTHCPILGIELCYDRDKREPHRDEYPTLDRRDNSIGYVPGNVFVISWRANRLKWMATPKELESILNYMRGASGSKTDRCGPKRKKAAARGSRMVALGSAKG